MNVHSLTETISTKHKSAGSQLDSHRQTEKPFGVEYSACVGPNVSGAFLFICSPCDFVWPGATQKPTRNQIEKFLSEFCSSQNVEEKIDATVNVHHKIQYTSYKIMQTSFLSGI